MKRGIQGALHGAWLLLRPFVIFLVLWVDVYAAVEKCMVHATSVSTKKFSRIMKTLNLISNHILSPIASERICQHISAAPSPFPGTNHDTRNLRNGQLDA